MAYSIRIMKELEFDERGRVIIRKRNNSGGAVAAGAPVILDTSKANGRWFTTTTSQDDVKVLGVLKRATPSGQVGQIIVFGAIDEEYGDAGVKVDGTTDIAVGDDLSAFTTAGIAAKATAGKGGVFAKALEAYATNDSLGVIKCFVKCLSFLPDTTASGNTLDQSYDQGGAGVGRAITVNDGAVTMTKNDAGTENVLELSASPSAGAAGSALSLVSGANATGATLLFTNSGSGNDITGTAGWAINKAGNATLLATTLAEATNPAGTSAYISRDNTGDVTINALTGKTVNVAVAGTDVVNVSGTALTVTGNTSISGSLSFGGTLTVGDTLTVDELILDTDGVAPAGTNAYVVSDNTGDLTLNALTGKTINFAIAGSDQVALGAATMTFTSVDLATVGYVELANTTLPAGTSCYIGRDNTGDTTINALTAKTVNVAVNGVDEVALGGVTYVFNEASNDRDFRVESNDRAYMIYADGALNALVLGANTDTSSAYKMVSIDRPATTGAATTSYADLWVQPTGAYTLAVGTTATVASATFAEPNITTGAQTVTNAAAVLITGEPTEGGTGNYGLMAQASIGLIADDKDLVIGAGKDFGLLWSTADVSNNAAVLYTDATSHALHFCEAAAKATDWNVNADTHPTLYIHSATTPATDYIRMYHDASNAYLDAMGGDLYLATVNGTARVLVSSTGLYILGTSGPTVGLFGTTSAHTADTANGSLYLKSTSSGTKGFVCIGDTDLGLVVGSDGSVDRATTVGTNSIAVFNGTAPAGALTNGISIYSNGGEAYMMDAVGNTTLQTPHTKDGDYVIHSYSIKKDCTITIHLEKLVAALAARDPSISRFITETPGMKHGAVELV